MPARLVDGLERRRRAAQIDLFAGLLQLREGVLASFAEIGQRPLDLVAALERDALGDGRPRHVSRP